MWQEELNHNITTIDELVELGYLHQTDPEYAALSELIEQFPMSITRYYIGLVDKNDPKDPLRKLCIPRALEVDSAGVFDTSGEAENTKLNGLQHKYAPTALVLSTNKCACYCRFCFRKRLVGLTDQEISKRLDDLTDYVRSHPEISNILISGGDSLMNSNQHIERMLSQLTQIESIKFIRFGSRMLSVLPQRLLDPEFLEILERYQKIKPLYLIAHFDHPREITPEAIEAVNALKHIGIGIKNQTVLLKDVNDSPDTMVELMNKVTQCGISPYYIFQCRPVMGVKEQFQVPFTEANRIINETRLRLSGPAKQFRYALSHVTGKIEVLGMVRDNIMLFKYHQPKYTKDSARIFAVDVSGEKAWLTKDDVAGIPFPSF